MTTETLPRPAPVEVVSSIKPSEAIRLGCLIAPVEITGEWGNGQRACANRALFLGMFGDDSGWSEYQEVDRLLAGLVPPCGWGCMDAWAYGRKREPSWIVIHLNDAEDHHWSRERIASWLESQGL